MGHPTNLWASFLKGLSDIDFQSLQNGYVLAYDEPNDRFVWVPNQGGGGGGVQSVTGLDVNNADPDNPIVNLYQYQRILVVDGNASNGTNGSLNDPYPDPDTAMANAFNGSTIVWMPGDYTPNTNLFANGVNHVAPFGRVNITFGPSGNFNDSTGARSAEVRGDFSFTGNGSTSIVQVNNASNIRWNTSQVINNGANCFTFATGQGTQYINTDFGVCYNGTFLDYQDTDVVCEFDDFDGSTNGILWRMRNNIGTGVSNMRMRGGMAISSTVIHVFQPGIVNPGGSNFVDVEVRESYTTNALQCVQINDGSPLNANTYGALFRNCFFEGGSTNRGTSYMIGGNVSPPPGVRNLYTYQNCTFKNNFTWVGLQYGNNRYNNAKLIDCRIIVPAGAFAFADTGIGPTAQIDLEIEGRVLHNSTVGFNGSTGGRPVNFLGAPSAYVEQDPNLNQFYL